MRPHSGTGTGLVVVALTATIAALVFPVWSCADRAGTTPARLEAGSVPTRWGPLSAADRDFVVRVRLTGLWALPAAQQATGRAPSRAVETAGRHLATDHTYLGVRVRDVAARLRVALPSRPTDEQRTWLDRLMEAHGPAYASVFAALLRQEHGTLFSVAAEIRATTRNTLVRALADDAVRLLLQDLNALETSIS
ncbi:DUF4142 domain-containing protein [Streptomyces sp. NPDC000229]|uniref:DUF4142 domain-containing protein n=1 Tax=Streptomyces sp. NPDC000229 TaxID=3154247 RepID=UPI003329286D